MNTEVRFLLAIVLMLGVLVGTNILFPPIPPEEGVAPDTVQTVETGAPEAGAATETPGTTGTPAATAGPDTSAPVIPPTGRAVEPEEVRGDRPEAGPETVEERVTVESPLYRYTFSSSGARMVAAELKEFESFTRDGVVDLVPPGADGMLGHKLVVGQDTVDLTRVAFEIEAPGASSVSGGVRLEEGAPPETVRFVYRHPTSPFRFEVSYTFEPDAYSVAVSGEVEGLERPLLVTSLGHGLSFAEADSAGEAQAMAYVGNHLQDGIFSETLPDAELGIVDGPLLWAAFKSKFFVAALLAGEDEEMTSETSYLGGLLVGESPLEERVEVAAAQTVTGGRFAFRLFLGPQEYARLSALGEDMEEVNPYGWKFFRPIVRPFVSVIMTILVFLHNQLSIGYGWVLIIFGVLMRVLLFPLNHKAMKAQLRNMAVQPLVQEMQKKYKENPEKLQKEMMKLYKEHGFNPLAGCLPMLLPWPVLIALFFVFQNTVELRGVPFLWLPDLSAPDPLYILPVILGLSMFLMQFVNLKALDQPNPQMKMMMWIMPVMMVFIFFNLASGLNLYYATANIATLPQTIWIAGERKKVQAKGPPARVSSD